MAKAERHKKSTVASTVNTFQSAYDLPKPTRELNDRALTHFNALVTSREVSTFAPSDIILLTNAALTLDAIDAQWDDIHENGWKVYSEKGTPVQNPAALQLNTLSASLRAYMDKLGLSAGQRGLSSQSQDSRNKAEQDARKIIKKAAENALLA